MKEFLKNLLLSLLVVSVMTIGTVKQSAAQVGIGIQFGHRRQRTEVIVVQPPVCDYGYYDYEPYACAPYGFYGDGYFYNGIFIGVGPWANYGYEHGWGGHRFEGERGGEYRGQYQGHEFRGQYSQRQYSQRQYSGRGQSQGRYRDHSTTWERSNRHDAPRGFGRNSGHASERHDHK
jgi:hypothetical protein